MKQKRHAAILDLIAKFEIVTQDDLAAKLLSRGFQVTQATVSRDIKELKLTKIPGDSGVYKYAQPQNGEASSPQLMILSRSAISVTSAQNIVVIKTQAGMAQAAAAVLDALALEEVVGSLAGDDTIFCVVQDNAVAKCLTKKIQSFL